MSFNVPILFLVFNRPDTTAQVFERIRQIQPAQLFIAADGPRPGKEGEKQKCEEVRNIILKAIDWPCDVKTLFRDSNLGCGHAVSGAISWFFENVEEGIILEDDTLPDPSFFNFCKVLLEKYRFQEKIKMISGNNFQKGKWWGDGSYYFSAYSHIWGWASWRRTWQEYDFTLDGLDEKTHDKDMSFYFNDKRVKDYWKQTLDKLRNGVFNTWDIQLLFSMWHKRGLAVLPNTNLVTNIGFGASSTHTFDDSDQTSNLPIIPLTEIHHPNEISIDKRADQHYFNNFLRKKNLFERAKRKILRFNAVVL
jgi:hypothetical protein